MIDYSGIYAMDLAETGGEKLIEAIENNSRDVEQFLIELANELDISSCLLATNNDGQPVIFITNQTLSTLERLHVMRYADVKDAKSYMQDWNGVCSGVLTDMFNNNFTLEFSEFINNNFNRPFITLYSYSRSFYYILKIIITDIERPRFIY